MNTARPTLSAESLEHVPEEEREAAVAEFEAMCERMEARGPLTLDFGPRECGFVIGFDLRTEENRTWPAVGEIRLDTYTDLGGVILVRPDPAVVRAFPSEEVDKIEIQGADDEMFLALLDHPHLTNIMVSSTVESEDLDSDDGPPASGISDSAFAALARHPELRILRLRETTATDDTIRRVLEALPNLTDISLGGQTATFADLSYLHGRELVSLMLRSPHLRPAMIEQVPHLPALEALGVSGTGLDGDLDVRGLGQRLPILRFLLLSNTDGTDLPVEQTLGLRHALPDVEINDVHYSPKAVARLAKKFCVTLADAPSPA